MPSKNWWDSLPDDVHVLLNEAQVFVSAKERLNEIQRLDVVQLRRSGRLDVNGVIDQVIKAESDLIEAVRVYKKAGGNFRDLTS